MSPGEPITTARLNELLVKMYERRIVRALYDDPTKPWLPESYWRADLEAKVAADTQRVMDLADLVADRKRVRSYEDGQLANKSAADVMAEWDDELPKLQGKSPALTAAGWGRLSMNQRWVGSRKRPTEGSVQPAYTHECALCGRPITEASSRWKDHGGSVHCDRALVGDEWDDDEPDYGWHLPKPFHGEELDDDQ